MNDDELDRLFRGGATGADGPLSDLLTRMRQPSGRDPVPSPWLRATLDGAPVEGAARLHPSLTQELNRRRPWLHGLAPLVPALKGVLAGALVAGAAAAFVVAVHAIDGDRRLPVRVISPASSSSPAPLSTSQPGPVTGSGPRDPSPGMLGTREPTAAAHAPAPATNEARTQPSSAESTPEPSTTSESPTPESSSAEAPAEPSTVEPSDPMPQEGSAPDGAGE